MKTVQQRERSPGILASTKCRKLKRGWKGEADTENAYVLSQNHRNSLDNPLVAKIANKGECEDQVPTANRVGTHCSRALGLA